MSRKRKREAKDSSPAPHVAAPIIVPTARLVPPPQASLLVAYKYLESQHLNAMLTYGRIRIGTFFEYRKTELGAQRGDSEEATYELTQTFYHGTEEDLLTSPINNMPGVGKLIDFQPGTKIRLEGGMKLGRYGSIPDAYIYCMTEQPSAKLMADFGCDVCVKISEPIQFFRTVTAILFKQALHEGRHLLGSCQYEGRSYEYDQPAPPPELRKPPSYSAQKEVRGVWQAKAQPISSVIIESVDLTRFFSVHEF